jgi:hypothetical protein
MRLSPPEPADAPVLVVGRPSAVAFPPVCTCCAQPASRRFRYGQAFPRFGDEGQLLGYQVYHADIPLCAACLETQHRLAPPLSVVRRLLLLARTWFVIGLAGGTLVCLYLLQMAWREVLRGRSALVELVIGTVFALIAIYHFRAAWNASRHLAIPPETQVTSALAFSDDLSQLFEPERHEYRFQNPVVAERFRAANAGRQWVADSSRARIASNGRIVVVALVVAAAVLLWIAQWLGVVD